MTTALQIIPEPQSTTLPMPITLPSLLLIEDEAAHVDLLTDLFSDQYEVRSARDGLTALQMASGKAPDMILLDIMVAGHGWIRSLPAHEEGSPLTIQRDLLRARGFSLERRALKVGLWIHAHLRSTMSFCMPEGLSGNDYPPSASSVFLG